MAKNECGKERTFFTFTDDSRPEVSISYNKNSDRSVAPFDDEIEETRENISTSFYQKINRRIMFLEGSSVTIRRSSIIFFLSIMMFFMFLSFLIGLRFA